VERKPPNRWRNVIVLLGLVAMIAVWVLYQRALTDWAVHGLNDTNWWAVVLVIFAIAMLPWRIVRYFKRINDHQIPPNTSESKPKGDGESDSSSFW